MATRRRPFSGKPITPPAVIPSTPASPINALPTGQSTNINLAKRFSTQDGNAITVSDADSPVVTVVLSVPPLVGVLDVVPNVNVVISDNKTPRVTISGSAANINRALNGMYFIPYTGYTGTAVITVRASDGMNVDTDAFNVTVAGAAPPPPAAGPAPINTVPGPQSVQTGAQLALTNQFSIADSDSTNLTSTLNVVNGRATVSTGGGATVTGNNTNLVTIAGTVAQINAALASLTYNPVPLGFVGAARIDITTSDGVSTDTDSVNISVTSQAPPPPNPGPSTPPYYPFGSRLDLVNGKYPYGTVVSNRSFSAMDTDLRARYNQWRSARVYNVPNISGAKAVKISDDPYPNSQNALAVSEGQGYGMLLAAIYNDQATFDGLLRLCRARPAYSNPTNRSGAHLYLMDWRIGPNAESSANWGGGWNAVDGDLDIAYACLLAHRVWGNTGTTWNYLQEAKNTIAAIKDWNFRADGTIWSAGAGDVMRISDVMYGHFRAFAHAMNDNWWVDTVIPRCKAVVDKCQTVFSAANGGPACFPPDAVVNSQGQRAGQTIPTGYVSNFGAAFGVSGTYGSGNMNFVPSPGGMLDPHAPTTEMHYAYNNQRCGWRWGADVVFHNDTGVREQCNRMNRFVPGFLQNDPARTPIYFRINPGLQGPSGGPLSGGNAWPARGTVQGLMNGAQVYEANGSSYQDWVNKCYDYLIANWVTFYYDCELILLGMTMASGNWFTYPGTTGSGGGGVTNPNAPVNNVPGPQTTPQSTAKTFNTAGGNLISVTDPNSDNLTVNVTCTNGTLKAVQSAGGSSLADGFPSKVVYGFWPGWGAQRLTSVSENYNVVGIFAFRPAGNNVGNGAFTWEWPNWPTQADVQAVRARGTKVMLSVGGAGRGYLFDTRAKSTNFVNSVIAFINSIGGVDGVDFNHYEGGITDASNQAAHATEMIWIAQQLKAQYGSTFGIVSPPQPNSPVDQYIMKQLSDAGLLTWVEPQYYDWEGFKQVGFISGLSGGVNRNKTWVDLLGATKVCLGLSHNWSYGTSPTLAESIREWDACAAQYPSQRGVSCWNTELDAGAGNAFANTFKQKFGSATQGGGGQSGATVTNNNSSNVTISGTTANVNAALNGLVYTPTGLFTGVDTITIVSSDGVYTDTDTVKVTVGTSSPAPAPGPTPAPPPPPAGSTWTDTLDQIFGTGTNGVWLDAQPVTRFQTFANGGVDLTAYGTDGSTGIFGRWKDRSGRGRDLLEPDQFSRPLAHNVDTFPRAYIYDRAEMAGAGGINGPFYICFAGFGSSYYGTWLSDRTTAFNGVMIHHNSDEAAASGDIIASLGTGSARVEARCKSGKAAYTDLANTKYVIEAWWEGPGTPLNVRFNKGTGDQDGVSGNVAGISAGGTTLLAQADSPSGNDTMNCAYHQIVVMHTCPSQAARDQIASGVATRAGLSI